MKLEQSKIMSNKKNQTNKSKTYKELKTIRKTPHKGKKVQIANIYSTINMESIADQNKSKQINRGRKHQ